MNVSRSGYYKWLRHKDIKTNFDINREHMCELVKQYHKKHPSWGYRRINRQIRVDIGWYVSDIYVHKCCKFLGIKSVVRRYKYTKPGHQHIKYPNLIYNNWKVTKPLEKVVTDMTCIKYKKQLYDVTLYMDVFNNEIISYGYTKKRNHPSSYYDGLYQYLNKLKGINYPSVLHSDQGIIYSSMAFNNAHKDYNIVRSMSRVATPTDNSKMEAINGWIKDELYHDWDIDNFATFDEFIHSYIHYYNNERLAYSLNYKTPVQYRTELGFI